MFCAQCGGKIVDGAKFCGKCGWAVPVAAQVAAQSAPLEKQCAVCGTVLKDGMKFCPKCGGAVPAQQDTVREPFVAENSAKAVVEPSEMADLNQAIRRDLTKDAATYYNRGEAYSYKGDYDQAITNFNQAIRLDPANAVAYNSRGYAYNEKGDYDQAITDYTQAISIDPTNFKAYANRAYAYRLKGDYDQAIADYETALQHDPSNAVIRENLERALVLQARGR